jgi:hypothetical protein
VVDVIKQSFDIKLKNPTVFPFGPFSEPTWQVMDRLFWGVGLRPRRRLKQLYYEYESKIDKDFDWPSEALD